MGRFATLEQPKNRFSKEVLDAPRFSQEALDAQDPISQEALEAGISPEDIQAGVTATGIRSVPATIETEPPEKPTLPPREFRGTIDEFVRALGRGTLNVGSGLLSQFAEIGQASIFDVDRINELAEKAREISQKPKFQPGTDGGVKGFIANAVGDAIPFMAGTVAATIVGGPAAGFGVAYSVEGKNAYFDALEAGASQEQAEIEGMVVGSINAALELLQVERVIKFAKVGKGSVKEIAKAAKKKALKKVLAATGKFGKEALKTSITEGVQEALQETTSVLAPGITGRELPTVKEAAKRIGQAGLGGAVAGPILGGAGAITQAVATAQPPTVGVKPTPALKAPEKPAGVRPVGEIARPEKAVKPEIEPKPLPAKEVTVEKPQEAVAAEAEGKALDQAQLTERRDIKQIPQARRTPQQIKRLNEIEDDLVKRHADDFPEIDVSPKVRNAEVKKVNNQIVEHGIYQSELEGLGDIPDLSGTFRVSKDEIGDIRVRFEDRPDLLKKFIVAEHGGPRIDEVSDELGLGSFNDFLDAVELFEESGKAAKGAINEAALARALNSGEPSIELFALKHDMLKNNFSAAEINSEINEFADREGIDLELINPELISLEDLTDVEKKQAILRKLDKTFKPAKEKKIREPEQTAIAKAKTLAFKTKQPAFVFERGGKFFVKKKPPKKGEFIKITPPTAGELAGKTERLVAGPTPEQEKQAKLLRQRINIAQKKKGLTKTEFSDLKLKHGGSRRLTGIRPRSIEQLEAILKAVERARPKIIGHKKVVSIKTEKQIAELRTSLTDLGFMNDLEFQKVLDIEVRGKQAKFIDFKSFITQKEGAAILNRMHDTAQRLRVTEPIRRAVEKNPEIKNEIAKIDKLPRKAKDPSRLRSQRFFFQRMGDQANQPIYDIFLDLTLEEQLRSRERHNSMKLAEKLPDFAKIANDPEALQRVEDWIVSQSVLKGKPQTPKDITDNELRLAKLIQASFKSYETLARAGKFFEFFDNRKEMPQYLKFKQGIDKAFDIYNTKGYDALIKYLDTQDWGIVSAGYSPMESVVKKVSTNRMPDIAVGKGRIRQRGIAYQRQERDILQRWYSYMRQMDQLVHIQPRIKSLVRLVNDNQESFINPGKINSVVSTYLDNLKHTNYEDGLVEEWSRRLYSQAITVRVLADPIKVFRNLAQNLSFSEDRRDFFRLVTGTKLNAEDVKYLETYVQQSSVMMTDWAFVGEDPLIFKNLTKWIQRKTLYPSSDRINRLISFSAKISRVRRAFAKDQSLTKKMKEARFSDMQKAEQRMALSILAKDGIDEMARYIAKVHTDNTHFLYAREQRSPAEQTKLGKIGLNLALFRRAATEKALFQLGKVFQRGTGFEAKRRAASVLVTLLAMSTLVGVIWKKLTGQKYSPYSYFSFLELNFGGLSVATIQRVEDVYNSTIGLVVGAATLDPKKIGKSFDVWIKELTEASDLLIPFYDVGWRFIEATLGTENIDRQLGKKIRAAIDKEFKSRGLKKIDRNLIEKIQFFLTKGGQGKKKKTEEREFIFGE